MMLHKIINPLEETINNFPNVNIKNIKSNSKEVKKGDLFIAVNGNIVDGNNFIDEAIELGASAIITSNKKMQEKAIPHIIVHDARKTLSKVASSFYGDPSKELKVIGITGTNGKTTTASLIYSILKNAKFKVAQIGTLGIKGEKEIQSNSLTTPDALTLQKTFSSLLKNNFTHVVMEVSSHSLSQNRVDNVDFDIALFTNLTSDHLDYHKDIESYFIAKSILFEMLRPDAIAIVNNSAIFGKRIIKKCKSHHITYSARNKSDIIFDNLKVKMDGINGSINISDKNYKVKSRLIGDFNSENILAAVACAHFLKIDTDKIEKGIEKCSSIPGRMEIFKMASGAKVIIDYAHTPDAYEKVLFNIKELNLNFKNLYVLFGAGGDRDKSKRKKMGSIVETFATHAFIVPDNPRTEDQVAIFKDIKSGFKKNNYTLFDDRDLGVKTVIGNSKENDVVVILGKGRENYQIIGKTKFINLIWIL